MGGKPLDTVVEICKSVVEDTNRNRNLFVEVSPEWAERQAALPAVKEDPSPQQPTPLTFPNPEVAT